MWTSQWFATTRVSRSTSCHDYGSNGSLGSVKLFEQLVVCKMEIDSIWKLQQYRHYLHDPPFWILSIAVYPYHARTFDTTTTRTRTILKFQHLLNTWFQEGLSLIVVFVQWLFARWPHFLGKRCRAWESGFLLNMFLYRLSSLHVHVQFLFGW